MLNIKSVDSITLGTWFDNKEIFVIDVREPSQYQIAHIAGTINIPLSKLENEIYTLNEPKNRKIIMVCQAGVRSMKACAILQQLDDNFDTWNLEGGINEWHMSGLPLIKFK